MIDVIEVQPHTNEENFYNKNKSIKIFLAGTIDNGDSINWQKDVIKRFNDFVVENDGKLPNDNLTIYMFNPRRDNWDKNTSKNEMEYQINWELDHLEDSNIIIMNLLPDSKSPISLMEIGLFARSKRNNLVIICPQEFYRYDNVKVVANRYNITLYNNIDEFFIKEIQW